jgi:acyl-CoA synthetase (AMP-forming)/AMP-acid ligase II
MSGVRAGLRQIGHYLNPKTLKTMREANAMHPLGLVAFGRSAPWLLGRGPSLGILAQMHSLVLRDKPAIHDSRGTITYAELDRRSDRAARALEAAGVGGRDRVAMVLRNGREMVEIMLGTQKLGVVACPLNTWAKQKELEATFQGVAPKLVFYDTGHAEQVRATAPEGAALVAIGEPSEALSGSFPYEEWVEEHPAKPLFPIQRGAAPKVVIHTSGTTGRPKGAQRDSTATGISALVDLLSVIPYRRDDIVLCPAPMFHSFGLATFVFAFALGATLVLLDRFDPEETLSLIEEHDASAASLIPVMARRVVSLPDEARTRCDLSSLRITVVSGSAMSEDLRHAAMDVFGDTLYDLYGSTEVGWVTIARPSDIRERPRSVGKPVPGIEVAVLRDGKRQPPGEIGELYIKSDIAFEGYTSGESKDVIDGYMSIGDLGRLDEDGYLYIEGRADDMVVVGGENVYPVEIEGIIEGVAGVREVAVIGVPDDEYGQVLAAFVVGDASESDIRKACEAELASFKVPRHIHIVDELPRTSTGKVLKRDLAATAEEGEGGNQ